MAVVHRIRSRVKRKCSDHDDTLSRSGLESKSIPHRSLFVIHAIFTSVVRQLLMNWVIVMKLLLGPLWNNVQIYSASSCSSMLFFVTCMSVKGKARKLPGSGQHSGVSAFWACFQPPGKAENAHLLHWCSNLRRFFFMYTAACPQNEWQALFLNICM